VYLAKLAGLAPAGALCEIVRDEDGEMSRMDDLVVFSEKHGLVLTTIADIQQYRRSTEPEYAQAPPPAHYPTVPDVAVVSRGARTRMPTSAGDFDALCYAERSSGVEHLALLKGDIARGPRSPPTPRKIPRKIPRPAAARAARRRRARRSSVHSECATGDIFGSKRCDCGEQLKNALAAVEAEGRGVVLYVRGHEGRGIGLGAKIEAYSLQDGGRDTVEANSHQGLPVDARSYAAAAAVLLDLGLTEVRLMTNNPAKCDELAAAGVTVAERVPIITTPNEENYKYLLTKQKRMGHLLNLKEAEA